MSKPPDPEASIGRLHALHRVDALSREALVEGVSALTATRPPAEWRAWLWRVCVSLGVLLTFGSSAYYAVVNWTSMGAWGQVGLATGTLAVATGFAVRLDEARLPGQLTALASGLLIGPVLLVLAAVSETDGWWVTLYATWAVLMVPSVLAARMSAAGVAWVAVLNLTVLAAFEPVAEALREMPMALPGLGLAVFNLVALAAWEALAPRVTWMQGRWPQRVIGAAAMVFLTGTTMPTVYWDTDVAGLLALPLLAVVLVVAQVAYWRGARDLFLAALPLLALLVVIGNAGVRLVIEVIDDMFVIMLGTPVIIVVLLGLTVMVLAWLRAATFFGDGEGA